jgi:hydrogenase large subunit
MAAVKTIDDASSVTPPANGRILRNLVLGSNFLQSHILHFYHLALLDYVDGPDMPPWTPAWSADKRVDPATSQDLVNNYLAALAMRRKAHEAGAVLGGRLPAPPAFIPGGFTSVPGAADLAKVGAYLDELIPFIQNTYIPDVLLLESFYSDYSDIGVGCENLLAYGVFDLDQAGSSKLLKRGRVEGGSSSVLPVDEQAVTESVTWSWYNENANNQHPSSGDTVAQYPKGKAYSWLKAPRYSGQPYEVGPLARMWVNGDYSRGISIMDRHLARAQETLKVAQAMKTWLTEIQTGQASYTNHTVPQTATGYGLTEAPRGALGHWLGISLQKISHYQVVTPTCWNASPRDTNGVRGPIEQALIGTPVGDPNEPVELLRVVHSFDPCLSCAVHVTRPGSKDEVVVRSRWGRGA